MKGSIRGNYKGSDKRGGFLVCQVGYSRERQAGAGVLVQGRNSWFRFLGLGFTALNPKPLNPKP